ncbi:ATP-dependent DNA helicase RecG [Holzapfeliella sp. JNUCC 80]
MKKKLLTPLKEIKNVGPKTLDKFKQLNLSTVYDVLYSYPRKYDDYNTYELSAIENGQKSTFIGRVITQPIVRKAGFKRTILSFKLKIDHEIIMVSFFNQPWMKSKIEQGEVIAVYGTYQKPAPRLNAIQLVPQNYLNRLMPSYSLRKVFSLESYQKFIVNLLKDRELIIDDAIPLYLRQRYQLLNDNQLIRLMHFPKTKQQQQLARRSAAFREFFLFQMQLQEIIYQESYQEVGVVRQYHRIPVDSFIEALPFELSNAQSRVVNEILADMAQPKVMHRLIQGDVGSGKTIVAAISAFGAITAGYQVALMAPTEILAQQHFAKLKQLLNPFGVSVALLTGSLTTRQKQDIYHDLATGKTNFVVGTHALIQKTVAFKKLGLVIVDEQHRFGVNQRQKLIDKGEAVDLLSMTATPIPRTLAMTAYGNLDISTIDELPQGRQTIVSQWVSPKQATIIYQKMLQQLKEKFQIYVVSPLIEDSEQLNLENVEALYDKMSQQFPDYSVGLLHGKMSADQKQQVMTAFEQHKIDILVSTTVIEVGVDVKNANMMVIFNADSFGLSQLHQLRGRVGRGQTQAYCLFVSEPKSETGKKRMAIIEQTTDGFVLAEEDLKLRGQGDLFGHKQSGVPQFQVGDILKDYQILVEAKNSAQEVLTHDPLLTRTSENQNLKQLLNYLKSKTKD